MRTILALSLTTLVLLTACGGDSASSAPADQAPPTTVALADPPPPAEDGSYPDEAVDEFLEGCISQAGEDICVCAIDLLQVEVAYSEFVDLRDEMEATGSLPPDLLGLVVENCV